MDNHSMLGRNYHHPISYIIVNIIIARYLYHGEI